jgi:uncharacterized membrane protein YhdT
MESKYNPVLKYVIPGVLLSAVFTTIIAVTAANLTGFEIVGKTVPFAYPWRLTNPNAMARITAWGFYLTHNIIAWVIIYLAQRQKPKYGNDLRWFNWAMIATSIVFIILHILQTQIWYDGLAMDVPELTALGSVAIMLAFIIILETPRRGLIVGKKVKFHQQFMRIVREYHGYFFSWAIIYTFWYHPTEGTIGHLAGFFYMFMLFVQSTLIFNRAHINKWWTVTLEVLVLIHGTLVAIFQGNGMWPMFAFGFGAMFFLVQMYGLGLNTWTKRILWIFFITISVSTYAFMDRLPQIHEIIRIPALDYMMIGIIYLIFLAGLGIFKLVKSGKSNPVQSSSSAQ